MAERKAANAEKERRRAAGAVESATSQPRQEANSWSIAATELHSKQGGSGNICEGLTEWGARDDRMQAVP